MISFLRGKPVMWGTDFVAIDVNGVGFGVNVPTSIVTKYQGVNDEIVIYTYLYVREDNMNLYGFDCADDLKLFKLLINVSGIGPKGALSILSTMSGDELRFAVLSDDSKAIAKAPGIGNKTAVKAIIELKDKIDLKEAFELKLMCNNDSDNAVDEETKDAIMALTSLGYTNSQALKAVSSCDIKPGAKSDDILKAALKAMVKLGY